MASIRDQRKPAKVSRTCQRCGKTFWLWPSDVRNKSGKYCSRDCYRSGLTKPSRKQIERQCEKCGKTFTTWQSSIDQGWGRFCGFSCSNSTKSKPRDWKTLGINWYISNEGYARGTARGHPVSKNGRTVNRSHVNYWEAHDKSEEVASLLTSGRATIHHLDGNGTNDDPPNLELRIKGNHPHGVGEHDMVKVLTTLGYKVKQGDYLGRCE